MDQNCRGSKLTDKEGRIERRRRTRINTLQVSDDHRRHRRRRRRRRRRGQDYDKRRAAKRTPVITHLPAGAGRTRPSPVVGKRCNVIIKRLRGSRGVYSYTVHRVNGGCLPTANNGTEGAAVVRDGDRGKSAQRVICCRISRY